MIHAMATAKMWPLYREKYIAFPPISFSMSACYPFSYANVNVNMYFEAVLLLVISLSH